jgi:hypothetical protein
MARYNSQLAGIQNEEPLSELGNKDEDYSITTKAKSTTSTGHHRKYRDLLKGLYSQS